MPVYLIHNYMLLNVININSNTDFNFNTELKYEKEIEKLNISIN